MCCRFNLSNFSEDEPLRFSNGIKKCPHRFPIQREKVSQYFSVVQWRSQLCTDKSSAFHCVSLGALNHRQTINKLYFISWFEHRYSFCLCIVLLVKDKDRTFAPSELRKLRTVPVYYGVKRNDVHFGRTLVFIFLFLPTLFTKTDSIVKSLTIEISKLISNSTWIFAAAQQWQQQCQQLWHIHSNEWTTRKNDENENFRLDTSTVCSPTCTMETLHSTA